MICGRNAPRRGLARRGRWGTAPQRRARDIQRHKQQEKERNDTWKEVETTGGGEGGEEDGRGVPGFCCRDPF